MIEPNLLRGTKLRGGKFFGFLRAFLAGLLHGAGDCGALVIGRDGIVKVRGLGVGHAQQVEVHGVGRRINGDRLIELRDSFFELSTPYVDQGPDRREP